MTMGSRLVRLSNAPQHLEAVHSGQLQVQQDDLRTDAGIPVCVAALRKQVVQRLDSIVRHDNLVQDVVLLQRTQGQCLVVGVVLDQQYDLVVLV